MDCRASGRTSCISSPATSKREENIMFDLTDRTALVTGATGGIGAAIARAMHAKGAVVAISGRRGDMLDALAGQLGGRVHVIACDIASKEEVEGLVPAAE